MYGFLSYNRPVHTGTVCVTPPASEPITLAQAKVQCRVDSDITTDDDLITALITAARQYAETHQRRSLLTTTWRQSMDNFPVYLNSSLFTPGEIRLPFAPLQSVTSIEYYNTAGDLITLDSDMYYVDTDSQPGRILPVFGSPWPVITWTIPSAVRVTFVSGYTDVSLVPQTTIQAMLLLIGGWYQTREYMTEGEMKIVPLAVETLLNMDTYGVQVG